MESIRLKVKGSESPEWEEVGDPGPREARPRGEILKGLWPLSGHTLALPWLARAEAKPQGGKLFYGEATWQGPMSPGNAQ